MLSIIQRALGKKESASFIVESTTTVRAILDKLLERANSEPKAARDVLRATYQLFHAIKTESYRTVAYEFWQCAKIAGACAKHMKHETRYQVSFSHALGMQNFYLRKNRRDRTILSEFLDTKRKCDNSNQLNLLDESSALLEQDEEVLPSNPETLKFINIDQPARRLVSGFLSHSAEELGVRLAELKERPHSGKKREDFFDLQTDILDHVYELRAMNPLPGTYRLGDDIFQALHFALDVEASHIFYLKSIRDNLGLSSAFKNAAFLFGQLCEYSAGSNMQEETKVYFQNMKALMERQASNVMSLLACEHVQKSKATTTSEKGRAEEVQRSYADEQERGLFMVSAHYHAIVGGPVFCAPEPEVATFPPGAVKSFEEIHQAFLGTQMAYPSQSFSSVYQDITTHLRSVMERLMPQTETPGEIFLEDNSGELDLSFLPYVRLADNHFEGEVADISHTNWMVPAGAEGRLELLKALELYYDIKRCRLNEKLCAIQGSGQDEADLYTQLDKLELRLAMYRYLLKPVAGTDLLQIKQNCKVILGNEAVITPLIEALASQRLTLVNQELQASPEVQAQVLEQMNESSEIAPPKGLPKSAKQRKKEKQKEKKRKALEQEVANDRSFAELLSEVRKKSEQTGLSEPEWKMRKAEVAEAIKGKNPNYAEAHTLLDDWIQAQKAKAECDEDVFLCHKGLFDAYLYKATIFLALKDYKEAMLYIGKAWTCVAPETPEYARMHTYQKQKLLFEKGRIYEAWGMPDLKTIAFQEAKVMAEANKTVCFGLVLLDLKAIKNPAAKLKYSQTLIERMRDTSDTIFVDEYSHDEFFKVCKEVSSAMEQVAEEALKEANAQAKSGKKTSYWLKHGEDQFNASIEINQRLLEFSKQHAPTRVFDVTLQLAATYRKLRKFLPSAKREHLTTANQYLEHAKTVANRSLGILSQVRNALVQREKGELDAALNEKQLMIKQALFNQSARRHHLQRMQCLAETKRLCSSVELKAPQIHLEAMLQAIARHNTIEEIRNVLLVLNKIKLLLDGSSLDITQPMEALEETISYLGLKEVAQLGIELGYLTVLWEVELRNMPDLAKAPKKTMTGAPPDTLVWFYVAQLQHLANLKQIMERTRSAKAVGVQVFEENLEGSHAEKLDELAKLQAMLDAYQETNSNVPIPTVVDCLVKQMAHIELGMTPKALKMLEKKAPSMPKAFKSALTQLQFKHFWLSLSYLLVDLKQSENAERVQKSQRAIFSSDLILTPEQKCYYHFLTAHILHWVVREMSQTLSCKIQGSEREYFESLFDTLKTRCKTAFGKARSDGFLEPLEADIEQSLQALKALELLSDSRLVVSQAAI